MELTPVASSPFLSIIVRLYYITKVKFCQSLPKNRYKKKRES